MFALVDTGVGRGPHHAETGPGHGGIGEAHLLLQLEQVLGARVDRSLGGEQLGSEHPPATPKVRKDALDGIGNEDDIEFEAFRLMQGGECHPVLGEPV